MTDSRIQVGTSQEYLNTNTVTTSVGSVHNEVIDQGNVISPSVEDSGTTAGNSRAAATLAAAGTFQGVSEDVHRYGRVGVAIHSDNATDGTLTMEVSHDDVTWSGPTRAIANSSIANPHMWNIVERYFRIKYVNGTTEATNLSIQVQYSNNADTVLGHQLNATLIDETEAQVVRAALVGKTHGAGYKNVFVSGQGHLEIALPLTAFGEIQATPLTPVFQGVFEYTVDNTELTTNVVANGGTVTQATALAVVGTSATTASTACLQTKRHARYRSGQGGLSRFTTIFTSPVAGTEQLVGLADEFGSSQPFKNGFMVGYLGTVFGFHRFQNDAVTTYPIASWDDPLDGTGVSGITIDLTKGNVWQIQFQYLGFGAQYLKVEDNATGAVIQVHVAKYANENTTPSVYNPNFHHMIWANNGGTTSDMVVKSASYAFFIEGLTKYQELHQPQQSSGEKQATTVTSEIPIFTIRNKAAYASKTNFIDLLLENVGVSIEASNANNLGKVRLLRNATLGGVSASWNDINTSDSVVDIDVASTTVSGGKELITIPLAGKNDRENQNVIPYEFILAPGETITLAGSSAGSATINAAILWKELF